MPYSLLRLAPLFLASASVFCIFAYEIRPFLIERRANRRRELLCCMSCGYNLFACASNNCPECGSPIPMEQTEEINKCEMPPMQLDGQSGADCEYL